MNADDLDDGLLYDMDPVVDDQAESGNEADVKSETVLAEEEKPKGKPKENPKKRLQEPSKFQEKKKVKMQIDIDRKKGLSKEPSVDAITDYLNDALRRKNSDLSALELAEMYFKKTDFRSTAEFTEPRTLDNISKFIEARFGNMLPSKTPGKKNKKKGKKQDDNPDERKFIAILSMSALRACDVHRALRDIPGSSLKLINKNKIEVDLKLIQSTWARVLCCTPGRLQKVLNNEDAVLKKEEIKIVILDNSYLDQKMQNVLNIPETTETMKELTNSNSKVYLY